MKFIPQTITAIVTLALIYSVSLIISIIIGKTEAWDSTIGSPLIFFGLFIVLWFLAPLFIKVTHLETEKNSSPSTFLILGGGFFLIAVTLLIIWLI